MNPHSEYLMAGMQERARVPISVELVELFAHASGDRAAHHLDEEFATRSALGGRVVHGVLLLGFVSAVSSALLLRVHGHYVSTGYDGVRFRAPVIVGRHEYVDICYQVLEVSGNGALVQSDFTMVRDDGVTCCNGRHLMKRLP